MMFENRESAAHALAQRLASLQLEKPLVVAVPRGAVAMGAIIARKLKSEFDVVLVNKFAPAWQPELAIGAVAEDGEIFLNRIGRELKYTEEAPPDSAHEELVRLHRRRNEYTPCRKRIDPAGHDVIVVDDAMITGATMLTAVRYMKRRGAKYVVAAVPVATESAIEKLRSADVHLSVLDTVEDLFGVQSFYNDFPEVSDEDVVRTLTMFQSPASEKRTTHF